MLPYDNRCSDQLCTVRCSHNTSSLRPYTTVTPMIGLKFSRMLPM